MKEKRGGERVNRTRKGNERRGLQDDRGENETAVVSMATRKHITEERNVRRERAARKLVET